MSYEKKKTIPNLSLNSPMHQDAIINDKDFSAWQYNVADQFKGKTTEYIRQKLQENAFPFAVAMERWRGDYNFGTLIRNANAFAAREVFYIGNKRWDKRSSVGTENYTPVNWISTIEDFLKLKEKYVIVGVDNVAGSIPLHSYEFVPNTLFVFGEESVGLTPEMQSFCKDIIEIPMHGSVRSLNCGVASGIIMHNFVSKYRISQ